MGTSATSFTVFLLLLSIFTLLTFQVDGLGGKIGGRQKIIDVKSNKEVQDLGRYCVKQYNNKLGSGTKNLKFTRVVDAEKQVVSGIKYYLKINVANPKGVSQIFDAVVVVKPWENTKKMLAFSPSPAN